MLNKFRAKFNGIMTEIALRLTQFNIRPWMASLLGLVFVILAAYILIYSMVNPYSVTVSVILFALGGFMDAIDGALARVQNRVSRWGAFYDSFLDRVAEIIYVLALYLGGIVSPLSSYLYIVTSLLISYTRARAEAINIDLSGVGIMERAERILILLIGLLVWSVTKYNIEILMLILIILNTVTILQRILTVKKRI
jgi:archaetidylinositol phosphate synthase